jgi:hypothetical protein
LRDLAGAFTGAVLVFQDLTDRKALEHDLARQIARLGSTPGVELEPS